MPQKRAAGHAAGDAGAEQHVLRAVVPRVLLPEPALAREDAIVIRVPFNIY